MGPRPQIGKISGRTLDLGQDSGRMLADAAVLQGGICPDLPPSSLFRYGYLSPYVGNMRTFRSRTVG